MKKLALIATLLGLTSFVQANELVPFVSSCKAIDANNEFLTSKYNEIPLAGGPSVIRTVQGEYVSGLAKIYVDPKEKGFTVIIEFLELGKSCVLLMGDDFAPILTGNST